MTVRAMLSRWSTSLSMAPVVLFEVGPYLSLAFLAAAFPPLKRAAGGDAADFAIGFLGGLSAVTVLFPQGRRDGLAGAMKAWGLGLMLGSILLDAAFGWLRHIQGAEADAAWLAWPHFFALLVVSAMLGYAFHRMTAERLEAERQRGLAEQAAQSALRAKLAPHFIFNALNTLHAQIESDPREAQATTERLAALLRQVIEVSDQAVIPLRREVDLIEAYLGIEQARLGARLRVVLDIPEELESEGIPPLSLQVLVENAVKHGIAPLERGGEIRVTARRDQGDLVLEVSDPGDGIGAKPGTGTALGTLRARLDRPGDLALARVEGRTVASLRWRRA